MQNERVADAPIIVFCATNRNLFLTKVFIKSKMKDFI